MCLYTKRRLAKISLKPLECVKVIIKHYSSQFSLHDGTYIYETPYVCEIIDDEYINGKKPFKARGKIKRDFLNSSKMFSYGSGLIHVFKSIEDARRCLPYYRTWIGDEVIAFKCYIMPGTRYFEGNNYNACNCYAERKIMFGERVELKTNCLS